MSGALLVRATKPHLILTMQYPININESGGDLAMNENEQQVASMPSPKQPTSRSASVYKNQRIL